MYATILTVVLVVGQVWHDRSGWEVRPKEIVVAADIATIWTNALADGDFNANGNWTNQTPDAAHTPGIFDGTTQTPPTTNLDRSAGTGFHLIVTPDYTGGLGSSGTYLKWNGTTKGCTLKAGGGDYYLHMVTGNNADAIVNAPGINVTFDGEIFGLFVLGGNVTINSTCNLLTEVIANGNRTTLTIAELDATEIIAPVLRVEGATVTANRTWPDAVQGDIVVMAGTLDVTGLIRSEVNIHVVGGVMTYNPTTDPNAESPDLYVTGGGIFDVRSHAGTIPFTRAVEGAGGIIRGTILDTSPTFTDYNLDEPYP
jgi:hypothetical protein